MAEVLSEHLIVERDPSLAVRSCYGRHVPWLQLLDCEWLRQARERILPQAERLAAYRAAVWETYLRFCAPYNDVLTLHAVRALSKATQRKRAHSPKDLLVDHLMAYYWRGKLALDSELITEFFRLAPADL
jgi:hypothetical protein